jgi:GNAT superfamily N-acetyltransferase
MIALRSARPGDGAIILAFIREIAAFHGLSAEVQATAEDLEQALFSSGAVCGCELAFIDEAPAGYGFWHRSFSTFRGQPCMYLEDLAVMPAFRRQGVGRVLLRRLAQIAREQRFASLYWLAMDWNAEADAFYRALGAECHPGMRLFRIHGPALLALGR